MPKLSNLATSIAGTYLLSVVLTAPTGAQIVPDNTLPNNTRVAEDGSSFTINGGTTAGSNLFHSFEAFGVPTGKEVFFNNATTINNIITRVTGRNISNIDGLIRANGGAHLFLLNPNGIVFGPNARLNIGGSFFGSTAESIELSDGSFYSAIAPEAPPLLTINVPVGLQFGRNSGTIEVGGEGHALTRNNLFFDPFDRSEVVPHLAVLPGRTLALLGSDLDLTGSTVAVSGGHLELGSPRTGTVALTPVGASWRLDYTAVSEWGNIRLSQQALADVSGEGSTIQVRGQNLELLDGSLLLVQNSGSIPARIYIEVTDTVLALGTNPEATIPSGIANQNLGTGSGANVEISADRLLVQDGAAFESTTFASGTGGSWQIDLDSDLEIAGLSLSNRDLQSGLYARTAAAGQGGDITVAAAQVRLLNAGSIETSTIGSGMGGNLTIVAESLEIARTDVDFSGSTSTLSGSFSTGDGGSTNIDVERLILSNGGRISASALAEGNGGSITISAVESIIIDGVSPGNGNPSEVRADVREAGQGVQRRFGSPPTPSGQGGSIAIDTPSLHLDNQGRIGVNNEGPSDAGNAIVRADIIVLDNGGNITVATESGEGGNITLVSDSLQLRHGSRLTAEAGGRGNGGNVTIDTDTIALLEGGTITGNALEGNGGNIQIATQGIFLSPNSSITASSQFGVSGTVTINNPDLDPGSGLIELSTEAIDPSEQISTGCAASEGNYFAITGRGGLAEDPTATIRGSTVWRDWQDYSATAQSSSLREQQSVQSIVGEVGNLQANSPPALVEANAWIVHPNGSMELVALATHSQPMRLPLNCTAR